VKEQPTNSTGPVVVATDGSALGNPGPGGWCWFVDEQTYEAGGDPGPVTNNQMELVALTRCLLALGERTDAIIEIDSQYVLNAVEKWHHAWRRNGWRNSKGEPVANRELIEKLLELLEGRARAGARTDLRWVKAHNGSWRNENADTRARAAAGSAVSAGRSIIQRAGEIHDR
jgi:ribonuclease HI